MKYEIEISQPGRYGTETIKGEFDNSIHMELFTNTIKEHFSNVTITVTAQDSNVLPENRMEA